MYIFLFRALCNHQRLRFLGEQVRSQRLGLSQLNRLFKGFKRDLFCELILVKKLDRRKNKHSASLLWQSYASSHKNIFIV